MKNLAITLILVLSVAIAPTPALAQTNTGPTPGSFWYGIATTFENINLFFTFNAEKKTEKALTYAERRLMQAKTAADSQNAEAIEIALADYETKVNLASESSKKIRNNERAEKLLTSIADNVIKHQETLSEVLEKVPEEAREAIAKAIEVSKRGQEEATRQIAELKGEVEQLRQEIAELKAKDGERKQKIEELSKQKTESSALQPKAVVPQTQTAPTQKAETTQSQTVPKIETPKTTMITLPNGAVVEMDANGNIIRTIVAAPTPSYTPQPQPVPQYTPPSQPSVKTPNSNLADLRVNLDSISNNSYLSYSSKKGRQEIAIQDWMGQNVADFSIPSYVTEFNVLVTSYGFFYLAQ